MPESATAGSLGMTSLPSFKTACPPRSTRLRNFPQLQRVVQEAETAWRPSGVTATAVTTSVCFPAYSWYLPHPNGLDVRPSSSPATRGLLSRSSLLAACRMAFSQSIVLPYTCTRFHLPRLNITTDTAASTVSAPQIARYTPFGPSPALCERNQANGIWSIQ
jgi:hypothetical protein